MSSYTATLQTAVEASNSTLSLLDVETFDDIVDQEVWDSADDVEGNALLYCAFLSLTHVKTVATTCPDRTTTLIPLSYATLFFLKAPTTPIGFSQQLLA